MSVIYIKQDDRRPVAEVVITRGNNVVDLTGVSGITFKMRLFGKKDLKINSAAVITDAVNGLVEYRWSIGDTDVPGKYNAEWELLHPDSTTETFPTLPTYVVVVLGDLDN